MKSTLYLVGIIVATVWLIVSNLLLIAEHPLHMITNVIILTILVSCAIMYGKKKENENYNYNKENPNAQIRGELVSGTVYSAYPEKAPGLGWI